MENATVGFIILSVTLGSLIFLAAIVNDGKKRFDDKKSRHENGSLQKS